MIRTGRSLPLQNQYQLKPPKLFDSNFSHLAICSVGDTGSDRDPPVEQAAGEDCEDRKPALAGAFGEQTLE